MKRRKKIHRTRLSRNWKKAVIFLVILLLIAAGMNIIKLMIREEYPTSSDWLYISEEKLNAARPEMDVQLLTVNPYSRCGVEIKKVNAIVIHYTANPGATAKQNRDYFENLKDTHATKASSHFIVGLDGEIVQCIPTWEMSYASNNRNDDTISIECCHPDETGQFTKETYQSMVNLTAWLCKKFKLNSEDVIRHYDITEKVCPKYFVEEEEAWTEFKDYVQKTIEKD